jgi:hypothetical protein
MAARRRLATIKRIRNAFVVVCVHAAFTSVAPCRVRAFKLQVRAQAGEQQEQLDLQLNRRTVLGAAAAVTAGAALPLAAPLPASANKVLSADWEQVGEAAARALTCTGPDTAACQGQLSMAQHNGWQRESGTPVLCAAACSGAWT